MLGLEPAAGATFYVEECALVAGCLPSSWSAMVSRHQAPPSRAFCSQTGRKVWDVDEVMRWAAARPGRGNWARGDVRRRPSNRLMSYSMGTSPGWRPAKGPKPYVRTGYRTIPWKTPRVPRLSVED